MPITSVSAVLLAAAAAVVVCADPSTPPYNSSELGTVLSLFLDNIDMYSSGAVVAAPSKSNPDYWYHWVRDAAISMNVLYRYGGWDKYNVQIKDYVQWESKAQQQNDPNAGFLTLGEPKYFLNGRIFNGAWCRPQNDGAALRAIALTNVANELVKTAEGKAYVQANLYAANLQDPLVIKTDLEFVSHHWSDQSCDPWEEIFADHFFTKIVQRKALLDGATLATTLGDTGAAAFYKSEANNIQSRIDAEHWDGSNNIVMETPPGHGGPQKYHELDVAVLLGALYGEVPGNTGGYGPTDGRILSTAHAFVQSLVGVYAINDADDKAGVPGFMVGRYPNDTYNGYATGTYGNPWILCSNAVGELYYRNAKAVADAAFGGAPGITITELNKPFYDHALRLAYGNGNDTGAVSARIGGANAVRLSRALLSQGDGMLLRVKRHTAGANFHFSEQINKDTGYEQGANDLTWSYGTLLSATLAGNDARSAVKELSSFVH